MTFKTHDGRWLKKVWGKQSVVRKKVKHWRRKEAGGRGGAQDAGSEKSAALKKRGE